MRTLNDVTILIVNYKTYDLIKPCVESWLNYYPTVNLLLIDNGSNDESTRYIKQVANDNGHITALMNQENMYHGPAMDQGIRFSQTPYVFTLDSDCEVLASGFLEAMLPLFDSANVYAVGRLVYMNRYGYETETRLHKRIKYIHPYAMLLDREKYLTLKKFIHHGSPCIQNMKDADKRGYEVKHFELGEFIFHQAEGTCSQYGYGLGLKTFIESYLNKFRIFT